MSCANCGRDNYRRSLSAACSRSTRLVSHSVEPYANTQNHGIHGAIISEHFMMITKFNKRKCLFKEIVKISELCFSKKQTWQAWKGSSIFSIFYSAAICCVIKIFRMHEHKVFCFIFINNSPLYLDSLLWGWNEVKIESANEVLWISRVAIMFNRVEMVRFRINLLWKLPKVFWDLKAFFSKYKISWS